MAGDRYQYEGDWPVETGVSSTATVLWEHCPL